MPSQFDQTTERKVKEHWKVELPFTEAHPRGKNEVALKIAAHDFIAGRNSAKESLEDMAQALTQSQAHSFYCPWIERKELNPDPHDCHACEAIRMVKARGDWPLEEPTPGASGREGE